MRVKNDIFPEIKLTYNQKLILRVLKEDFLGIC